ncbi:cell division protein FtsQ [Lachnospiraceae bacterium ZAX-1]
MVGEKRKRRKRLKFIVGCFFSLACLLLLATVVAVKLFTVENIEVVGNKLYDNQVIEDAVLNDEYSWNSLYVYFKHRFFEPEVIPFVDTMEVSLSPPHTIQIQVYEKGILGYLYLDDLGQNVYFDKDGIVIETSFDIIKNVPKITGIQVEQIVLFEKLPIKEKNTLKNLLSLTQMLKKYRLIPDAINYDATDGYILTYANAQVLLGQVKNLNEKIVRLSYIMPELEGQNGVLHLENWTENTTDITFEKK